MHAEGGVAKDWPGPGATGCNDEGICRDMFGRSIDSSGEGMPVECQARPWCHATVGGRQAERRGSQATGTRLLGPWRGPETTQAGLSSGGDGRGSEAGHLLTTPAHCPRCAASSARP